MLGGLEPVELLLVGIEVLVVVFGLAISLIAFQGYRKHGSRPMLFVSAGFVLVVGVPAVLTLVFLGTPLLDEMTMAVLNRVSTVAGMGSILYGLWVDPD